MAILPTGSSERDPGKYYSVSYGSTGGYMGTSGYVDLKRTINNVPTVSDRIKPISLALKK